MEFIVVFLVSLVVLLAVALSLVLGKPPTYRPTRPQIMKLLTDVLERKASVERWEMFLSLPVSHDPELEQVRQQCLVIAYGGEGIPAAQDGMNGAIFDRRGLARLNEVAQKLKKIIDAEPVSKLF